MEAPAKQRLFIALPLPPYIREALWAIHPEVPGLRAAPLENYHLTLRFLGGASPPVVAKVTRALSGIALPAFALEVRGTGFFAPGILWAGLASSPPLGALRAEVDLAAAACGFGEDNRPFRPHITLARGNRPDVTAMNAFLKQHRQETIGNFRAERFALFESQTLPEGARYTELASFALA
jgi:2'-5' RNA ligase